MLINSHLPQIHSYLHTRHSLKSPRFMPSPRLFPTFLDRDTSLTDLRAAQTSMEDSAQRVQETLEAALDTSVPS